jgi:hypothetical protein
MPEAFWKPVPEYSEYEVSSDGEVRCLDFLQKGYTKVLKQRLRDRYLSVALRKEAHSVHRLVAAAFLGPANGRQVNHIDGDRTNNRPSNLEYCTASENMKHCFRIGLQSNKGERHSQSKLSENDIRLIRASHEPQGALAKRFNVRQSQISRIKRYVAWSHIS